MRASFIGFHSRWLAAIVLIVSSNLALACWPAQVGGVGTMAQVRKLVDDTESTDRTARALWWWCPAKFEYRVRVVACATADLSACLTDSVIDLASTTDAAALDKAWADNVRAFGTEREWIFGAFLRQALPLNKPAPPAWTVPYVSATTMSRPSYRMVSGKRDLKESGVRAPIASTCDCLRLRSEEGRSTYCAFSTQYPDLVALCRPVVNQPAL